MNKEDGRSLPAAALEERRKVIIRMKKAGSRVCDIMEATGASYFAVYSGWKNWQENGSKALKVIPRGVKFGERRTLTPEQELSLQKKIIDKHPDQLKLDFALWTRQAVRLLIRQEYAIDMPIRTVGMYLKRWGFTPQKPVKFAFERKDEAVKEWLGTTYPEISKRAKREGASIYWGDETGLRSSDVRGRGYSVRGKTPVVEATAQYQNISMISAITNQGMVKWLFVEGSVNADRFKEFLSCLIADADGKIFLVLDNLRVHHSDPVKEWVKEHKDEIELFFLPAYSPDLNPDEHLNSDIKYSVGSRTPVRTKDNLKKAAEEHMQLLVTIPERIVKYFSNPAISYAAN